MASQTGFGAVRFRHAVFGEDHADFVAQANQRRRQRPQYVRQAACFGEGSGFGGHHQDLHCAAAPSRCFCTLPSALRGSFSTTMKRRGHLKDAKFSRQRASSAAVSQTPFGTT